MQTRRKTPSGRKVSGRKKERRIMPSLVATTSALARKIYKISEKGLPNLLLQILSFPKNYRENQGHFYNPHEQGYWKMSKFFSSSFQEDEKFKK